MPKTLNKDGSPRKIGSGKTKGAGCYSSITWSELENLISEDVPIPVSRVWLRSLSGKRPGNPAFAITSPAKTAPSSKISGPKYDQPKESKISTDSKEKDAEPNPATDEEYEPPPLFAVGSSNLRQY